MCLSSYSASVKVRLFMFFTSILHSRPKIHMFAILFVSSGNVLIFSSNFYMSNIVMLNFKTKMFLQAKKKCHIQIHLSFTSLGMMPSIFLSVASHMHLTSLYRSTSGSSLVKTSLGFFSASYNKCSHGVTYDQS